MSHLIRESAAKGLERMYLLEHVNQIRNIAHFVAGTNERGTNLNEKAVLAISINRQPISMFIFYSLKGA